MSNYENLIGQVLDRRYQIVKIIGSGGMAVVFEAMDLLNNRPVAVKILKDEMSSDIQAVKRFINESKAVALLSHPGIVRIYDVVISKDLKYIVMERVQGITLKSYIEKKGALSLQEILSYSEQILRALAHAHSKGIIHRDIKPQNILLLKNGRIKVADFGIAKLPGAGGVTMTDKAIGTVYYISPEQASGQAIDPRSDLYSLGVCMYEMATGTLPFMAENPLSVAMMQVHDAPRPPREIVPALPFGLEQVILGAMEKDPNRRFQDATQMLRHVTQLRTDPAFVFHTKRVKRPEPERREQPSDAAEATETSPLEPIRRILDPKAAKKSPMKKKRKQSTSMFPIIMGVAVAFLIICIVCGYVLLSAFLDMQERLQPITVTVPNVVGEVLSEELISGYDDSLYSFQIKYVQSDDFEENTVVEQDPDAGATRKVQADVSKCVIVLTVSCAEDSMMLPDFTITDHRVAEQRLIDWGIKVTKVEEHNSLIDEGHVIRTDPEIGTPLKEGDEVILYVSCGPELNSVTVPDFVGKTTSEAYELMTDSKTGILLKVGTITYEYDDKVEAGRILQQSKAPKSTVVLGTAIDFVVSLGAKPPESELPETKAPEESKAPEETKEPSETQAPSENTGSTENSGSTENGGGSENQGTDTPATPSETEASGEEGANQP